MARVLAFNRIEVGGMVVAAQLESAANVRPDHEDGRNR
jgi:hypothetical protein